MPKKKICNIIPAVLMCLASLTLYAAPSITTFAPASGVVGSSVTITGTGFNTVAANDIVFFGATQATVTAATATSLTVMVPPGSTYKYISVTNLGVNLTAYSTKPFIVTFSGDIAFGSQQVLAAGTNPISVIISDIDHDGKPDLVVADYSTSSVSVLRNTSTAGSASFATGLSFATGSDPFSVGVADIDGDGKPDVVAVNQNDNTISVLRNTSSVGSISFAAQVTFSIGNSPNNLSISDIDGDGKPDVAVANYNGSNLSVLRNTSTVGTISFATAVSFATGFQSTSIVAGDIDGDGKPDLAVGNSGNADISVLRNTSIVGTISFATQVTFATGTGPFSISIGDIDGDGKPDLAVANDGSSTVSVLRNTSISGTINFATQLTFSTGSEPLFVAIGDIDGDGKPDLAVANGQGTSISVLHNTSTSGNISFAAQVSFATGSSPYSIGIGDLDGDGRADLVVANEGSNTLSVLQQTGPPTITSFSPANGPIGTTVTITGTGFNSTAANNIVFFGATQAAVTAATTTSLTVTVPLGAAYQYLSVTNLGVNLSAYSAKPFIVTLAGNIDFAPKKDLATGTTPLAVSVADLDGDGKSDLVLVNNGSNTISVLRNTSTPGDVSFASQLIFSTGTGPQGVSIGDIDGDGKPDVVVTNPGEAISSGTVSVLRNTSTPGIINFATQVTFATGIGPLGVAIGDIDGDGKPDLAVTNINDNTVSVLRNTSTVGSVNFASQNTFVTAASPNSVNIGDIDGDGKPDLVIGSSVASSTSISVLRNTSSPGNITFATQVAVTAGSVPTYVAIGDIDGDGKPDLAVVDHNTNTLSVLRNTSSVGTISFAALVSFATGSSPWYVSIGDIDGDGKPDLAIANGSSNTISVLHNTSTSGTVSFTAQVTFATGSGPGGGSIADIDGDGKPDLVTANANSNTASVLLQYNGTIAITSFTPASGVVGSSVTITGTGFNPTAAQNIVFFGATRATVTAATSTSLTVIVPVGATFQYISETNLEVNLTAYSAQPFRVTFANGGFAFEPKQDQTTGGNPSSVSIADLDGDGKPDLAVANYGSNTVSVFLNTSTPGTVSFANKIDFSTGANSGPESVSIGDIDGDGKPDLAVANYGNNTAAVLLNTSTIGALNFAAAVAFATGGEPISIAIGDLDGDGKPDLVTANAGSNNGSALLNLSTPGVVSFATQVTFGTGNFPQYVAIGDLNNDGKPDLAVANAGSSNITVARNTSVPGTISFAIPLSFSTGTSSSPYGVSIGDLDGDGKPDLAAADFGVAIVSVLLNNSTGSGGAVSFAMQVAFTTAAVINNVSMGDIDGDGKPDLAVTNNFANSLSLLDNTCTTGTPGFTTPVTFATGFHALSTVGLCDIDGDGKTDLVVANSGSNTVSVLRQEGQPQGSLTVNGPFCGSGTGQLTWTATAGTGPFTVVYNDGTANHTVRNVQSGMPFDVFTNPVTNTTTYSLISVSYPDSAVRTSGFTNDSATILVKPLINSAISQTICGGSSYIFNGHTYTTSGSYPDTATSSVTGCDSINTLTLTVTPVIIDSISQSICPGGRYSFGGFTYTSSGTYSDTAISLVTGCDSITTLKLSITPVINQSIVQSICPGGSYAFGGHLYTLPGAYLDTVPSLLTGCDSITTLTLTIAPVIQQSISQSVCAGSSYSFGISSYSIAGTYQDTATSVVSGCDSITTLTLSVIPVIHQSISQSICAGSGYSFSERIYTVGGTYTDTAISNVSGCDSITTLTLSVTPVINRSTAQSVCTGDSYFFGGRAYTTSGTYSDTAISLVTGCDSITTLSLSVIPVIYQSDSQSLCFGSGYTFGGNTYTSSGTYLDTDISAISGCDSITTLTLAITPLIRQFISQTICTGDSFIFDGHPCTTSGTYLDTSTSTVTGCDSITTLTLSVMPMPYYVTSQSICSGGTYAFNGVTYAAGGAYKDTLFGSGMNGCDSISALILTVKTLVMANLNIAICGGLSYNFNGVNYNTTGTYSDTLSGGGANGCDSIVNLHLIVNSILRTSINDTICNGASLMFNGHILTQNGIYLDTLQSTGGCDSIITLNLMVRNILQTAISDTICNGVTVVFNGHNLIQSGMYKDTLQSITGCDSIIILNLTVNRILQTAISDTTCNGATIVFNWHNLTQSGIYVDTLQSVTGCDSIVTLNLFVNIIPIPTITRTGDSLQTQLFTSYQWLFNGAIVNGGTNQNLVVVQEGNYSVVVTGANVCIDTSAVLNVTGLGINDLASGYGVKLYPNPNNGSFVLKFTDDVVRDVEITDAVGRTVMASTKASRQQNFNLDELSAGVYIVRINEQGQVQSLKFTLVR